jgi:hypothetical protein
MSQPSSEVDGPRIGRAIPDVRRAWTRTKALLVVTAVAEVGTGLALLVWPPAVAVILLGSSLDTAAGVTVGRVAGGALLSIGVACWLTHDDGSSHAARALVISLLLYNVFVAAILAFAGIVSHLFGVALWPVVALHAAMALWCVACLWGMRS